MADNPATPTPAAAAEAGRVLNATINEMMGQSITDEMFGDILEGAIVWEDEAGMIPVAEEATSLDPEPAPPTHDAAQIEEGDHDAD